MAIRISREVLNRILDLAAASPETEACGLLLGHGDQITEARETANVAADPRRRFEIDPAALIAAHKAARSDGPKVLGHYHSHPGSDVRPSVCDAETALADGALWLICGPSGSYSLWKAGDEGLHDRFAVCAIMVEEQP